MKATYTPVLFRCMLVSLTFLTFMTIASWHPLITMISTLAPLIFYHIAYLLPRAKGGLSQTAIDSVYYFGFLVTIGALGASAIKLGTSQKLESLADVGFQFGLGLLATGYAVFARMQLSGAVLSSDGIAPEEAMNKIVVNSRELATNIKLATQEFDEYLQRRKNAIAEAEQSSINRIENSILLSTQKFNKSLDDSAKESIASLKEFRALMADVAANLHRSRLTASISAAAHGLEKLAAKAGDVTNVLQSCVTTGSAATLILESLTSQLATCDQNVKRLGGEEGTLVLAMNRLNIGSAELHSGTMALRPAIADLREIATIIGGVQPTFKVLRSAAKKATEQIDALALTTETFVTIANRFGATVRATEQLSGTISTVNAALIPLRQEAATLAANLENASRWSVAVSDSMANLRALTINVIDSSTGANNALNGFAATIKDVIDHGNAAGQKLAQTAAAIDSIAKLVSDTQSLHGAITSTKQSVGQFNQTVQDLQQAVVAATKTFKTTVAESTAALAIDVQRSTEAAQEITKSFITIAENVIEHTKSDGMRT